MADINDIKKELTSCRDLTSNFMSSDIEKNRFLSLLSYIGILIVFPFFMAKGSKFARFNMNQGLTLLLAEAAVFIVKKLLGGIPVLGLIIRVVCGLAGIVLFLLAVLGIYNCVNGRAKELPFVRKFSLLK